LVVMHAAQDPGGFAMCAVGTASRSRRYSPGGHPNSRLNALDRLRTHQEERA
jgi:hypothetical protein